MHMRRSSLLLRREGGAAAVEFALISVLLFTVLFGIIQYGIWLSEYEVYQGAAREGARFGAVRCANTPGCQVSGTPSMSPVADRVTLAARPYQDRVTTPFTFEISSNGGSSWAPTTTGCTGGATIGNLFRVSWTQHFDNLFALIPSFGDHDIEGVFRCE